jgi:hypothetical protein
MTVGFLSFLYFARLAWEVERFSSNKGLLHHRAVEEVYPFLWQPLFRHHSSDGFMFNVFTLSCLVSLLLVVGVRCRACSVVLYLVAVCSYRWNFQIVSVDDGLMHLFLFWLIVLPLDKADRGERVSRAGCRLLFVNLSLMYLVAGLSKWTSPMWREGSALSSVLQLPGSWIPELSLIPSVLLSLATWSVLVLEPSFALLPWLKKGPWQKALAVPWFAFHLSTAIIMDVALANLLCLSTGWLLFADTQDPIDVPWSKLEKGGALVLVNLILAMVCSCFQETWRQPGRVMTTRHCSETGDEVQRALYAGLWTVGLAQQYRLLDWIDDRDFSVRLQTESDLESEILTLREGIALSYLSDVTWLPLPPAVAEQVKTSSMKRWRHHLPSRLGLSEGSLQVYLHRTHPGASTADILLIDIEAR